jgi:hypothetical protein
LFVIPAQAGMRRQDAEANIGVADGPKGGPQERPVIQRGKCQQKNHSVAAAVLGSLQTGVGGGG